jgi:DNA-3-methyladenine glycosylase II
MPQQVHLTIEPHGPFSWRESLDLLSNLEAMSGTWQREDDRLYMALLLDKTFEPVALEMYENESDGRLEIAASGTSDTEDVQKKLARIFSLDQDATKYAEIGTRDPVIGQLQLRHPGLRPVSFVDPYEAATWAIIGLRISMRQAGRIRSRLVEEHGELVTMDGRKLHAFPTPEQLLGVSSFPGLAAEKVERLHGAAMAALEGQLDADTLRSLPAEEAISRLQQLRGIGPWWAAAIYHRGCGITDELPKDERSREVVASVYNQAEGLSESELERLAEAWRPFRMWVSVLIHVEYFRSGGRHTSTRH